MCDRMMFRQSRVGRVYCIQFVTCSCDSSQHYRKFFGKDWEVEEFLDSFLG